MSEQFYDAIAAMMRADEVALEPTHRLIYLVEGVALSLPVAVRPPVRGYKTAHWFPVVLSFTPVVR